MQLHRPLIVGLMAAALASPTLAQNLSTLDKAKASGSITIAYREASLPFSYLGADAQPTGFGWEICGRIIEQVRRATGRSDLVVKTQAITAQNRIPLLLNGTVDVECGSTTNNAERNKQVAFSINYFYTGTRFLVRADSPVRSVADLKGRKVVSTTGTSNLQVVRKLNVDRNLGFELISAKDHAESALLVQQGRADAFGMDDILLYGVRASALNPSSLAVVGEAIQVEPYAVMFRKDDPGFKKLVDDTIKELIRTGEFTQLYKKWFESPIPPKGINLNAPMSDELRANLKNLSDQPAQ